jgi:hydroxyacylglutathione hydrolase
LCAFLGAQNNISFGKEKIMENTITRISLGGIGKFNCYLIKAREKFILVDTGVSRLREKLKFELDRNGCTKENLILVILTNGTMDSIGNAFYIKSIYGAKIAIHEADKGMLESVVYIDRDFDSKINAIIYNLLIKKLSIKMMNEIEHLSADIKINEKFDIESYGIEGSIIEMPGFTKGSIGILFNNGDFISGNSIINQKKSFPPFVLTSFSEYKESIKLLKTKKIKYVYPGMGEPIEFTKLRLIE